MAQVIACPSCHKALRIPDDFSGNEFTCPRCLARVNRASVGLPRPPSPPATTPSTAREGTAVEDVQKDSGRIGCGLIGLAVLGAIPLFWWLLGGLVAFIKPYPTPEPLIAWVVAVLFLGMVATGIVWARAGGKPSAVGGGRILVTTLALAGGIFLGLLAVAICFFVVCLAELNRLPGNP